MQTKNQTKTMGDSVYSILKKGILEIKLKPGEEIKVKTIVESLGVSRSPVRDAINKLGEEGLVNIIPQKGTTVSKIDLKRAEEERFIRETLEFKAILEFAKQADKKYFYKLEDKIKEQKISLIKSDYTKFMDKDDEFHEIFFKGTGKELCVDIVKNFSGHYRRIRFISAWDNSINEDVITQHIELLKYLREANIDRLSECFHNHCRKIFFEIEDMVKKYPNYFKENNVIKTGQTLFGYSFLY